MRNLWSSFFTKHYNSSNEKEEKVELAIPPEAVTRKKTKTRQQSDQAAAAVGSH